MKTPIVPTHAVPAGAIWHIGQLSKTQVRALDKQVRQGTATKVRASWCGISPLKPVWIGGVLP